MTRSNRPDVRNPVLGLRAAARLAAMPAPVRELLAEILLELAGDARRRANEAWKRHKAPMACYWKAVAVYARHLARAVRPAIAAQAPRIPAPAGTLPAPQEAP
jgi:hypothetical protein